MHSIAAASSSGGVGIRAYLAVFAATAAGYMGVPFVGAAAVCTAAVLASQGQLNIAAVFIVAAIGNEVGGLLGYKIGDRWGRQLLEHPGPALELRKKAVAKGEAVVAVGTALAGGPPRRSQRAELPHWAPTMGGSRRSAARGTDA